MLVVLNHDANDGALLFGVSALRWWQGIPLAPIRFAKGPSPLMPKGGYKGV